MRERLQKRGAVGGCSSSSLVALMLFCALLLSPTASIAAEGAEQSIWIPTGLYTSRMLDPSPPLELMMGNDAKGLVSGDEELQEPSPALAVALSAVMPGAGQLYSGNRRGLIYFAVEVAALIAHFSYRSDGHRKEDQFKDFADAQWDTLRYREGSGIEGCSWSEESDSTIVDLMQNHRNRYYEQVAREEYACGWREPWQRDDYRELRDVSNSLLGKANTAMTIIFLNHIVSAVDAFRIARSMRMEVAPQTELRMDVEGDYRRPRAVFRLVRHL
ncbi:MAG: hypothetical protein KJ970_10885 [Candidatus Eisenbacteria bacterium]|uniref:DUF5683 domain-containing protein n=1 Tax=Eiseniibacteriota bacterium TaxID=2212470 RepID=A0A948W6S1_UNCEI|nr:hypothetical protein [Candidatus Eisenbacteria bacterium]MBU1947636.1 hypothetical protein [Candidatus Eisenbacteria bacterium]MBU2691420.1 hypothetical protein [Candidatus Eisenbacteria bacterium]